MSPSEEFKIYFVVLKYTNRLFLIYSHKEYEKRVEYMLRKSLRRGDVRGVKAWKEYIVLTMNYFLQYNNISVKDYNSSVNAAVDKIVDFEINLTEVHNFHYSIGILILHGKIFYTFFLA